MIKYEFRRAFGKTFFVAVAIGILSGISGIYVYHLDTQWNELSEISCYDAWLYCFSVSESSIYRAIFPLLVCLPYLQKFYSDRNSTLIYSIITRTSYLRFYLSKIFVGIISSTSVVVLVLGFWFVVSICFYPANLPVTIFNYSPGGAFSEYYAYQPLKYIIIILILNIISGNLIYLVGIALSYFAKNRNQVLVMPNMIYLFLILISQIGTLSFLDPVVLIAPLEATRLTFSHIAFCWLIILIASLVSLFSFYQADRKEIL